VPCRQGLYSLPVGEGGLGTPPPPPPFVLIGHAASFTPY